jgi:hypothetical protein
MNTKFLKNLLLAAGLVICGFISAQMIRDNKKNPAQKINAPVNQNAIDTVPLIDNSEGLAELNKIIRHYENADLAITGDIYYYNNIDSSAKADEQASFRSVMTGSKMAYEIDSVLTIADPDLTLIVDNKEKSLAVFEQDEETAQKLAAANITQQIKEFLGYIYSIKVDRDSDHQTLEILFNDNAPFNINRYQLIYDPNNYRIKKIRVEMTDGEISDANNGDESDSASNKDRDELMFVDSANNEIATGYYATVRTTAYEIVYKSERVADASMIDINKFITKADGGYEPVGVYRNYDFQN